MDEQVVRGELDFRTKGKVTGTIWLIGRADPIRLDLVGTPSRDLAGHLLTFANPTPKQEGPQGLHATQEGVVGVMTASRKTRVLDCSMDEFAEHYKLGTPFPWHWGNTLYLEWFSQRNGRVVIESAAYTLSLDGLATWTMTPEEEQAQSLENQRALTGLMGHIVSAADPRITPTIDPDSLDDAPQSDAEKAADAEQARMDLLFDRVDARIEREQLGADEFERIWEEERERLRIERGEPAPPPLTPEQEAEREAWIDEMNEISEQALKDYEAEVWKRSALDDRDHPLVERCSELGLRVHQAIEEHGWLPKDAGQEHPLHEIAFGLQAAGAKLAGALGASMRDDPWPPDPLFAGDTLVRLKKARSRLADTLRALDSADAENLALPEWRTSVRQETAAILAEVQVLIQQVREVLKDAGEPESD